MTRTEICSRVFDWSGLGVRKGCKSKLKNACELEQRSAQVPENLPKKAVQSRPALGKVDSEAQLRMAFHRVKLAALGTNKANSSLRGWDKTDERSQPSQRQLAQRWPGLRDPCNSTCSFNRLKMADKQLSIRPRYVVQVPAGRKIGLGGVLTWKENVLTWRTIDSAFDMLRVLAGSLHLLVHAGVANLPSRMQFPALPSAQPREPVGQQDMWHMHT